MERGWTKAGLLFHRVEGVREGGGPEKGRRDRGKDPEEVEEESRETNQEWNMVRKCSLTQKEVEHVESVILRQQKALLFQPISNSESIILIT